MWEGRVSCSFDGDPYFVLLESHESSQNQRIIVAFKGEARIKLRAGGGQSHGRSDCNISARKRRMIPTFKENDI